MAAGEEDEARAVVGASRVAAEVAAVFLVEEEDVAFPVAEAGAVSLAEGKASLAVVAVTPAVEDAVSPAVTTQVGEATQAAVAVATIGVAVLIAAVDTIGIAAVDITGAAITAVVSA
jgi:hypothetical protein